MKNKIKCLTILFLLSFLFLFRNSSNAQQAIIKEELKTFKTYPFSDPTPVARIGRIYPYFRFDGYSDQAVDQQWKIITLENPYIKVLIAPEIGGKILGAFEKSTGNAFIYFNKVVKFRDIAMRGPWTSGGIEINFGSIGHAPTTATPVDYLTRENEDGSVSCVVGAMDLSSRTEWRVEIRLPKDKAYFETRSLLYNPTELSTSLYHWMNAAADATDDLRYYFPGSHYIDHGGNAFPWHTNKQGRDVSFYRNNNFGGSKSYHVLGEYTDFFAGYYRKKNFGFCHWSLYGDKPGKKIWIWALSRQGEIWKELLTDPDLGNEQYTEIQTGLLFNQAGGNSSKTPFKHLSFPANGVERFNEIWFPTKNIGGVVKANQYGSLNVSQDRNHLIFAFCPIQEINEKLRVMVKGKEIYKKHLALKPLDVFLDSVLFEEGKEFQVSIGKKMISYSKITKTEKRLTRPVTANEDFDWDSAAGIYTQAVEYAKQRDYKQALQKYFDCLKKDPAFNNALIGAAEIYYRRMEYKKALDYILKALANDTYDPEANFIYGIISKKLSKIYDAKDGFSLAAKSLEYCSAANYQLAEILFNEDNYELAENFALRSLDFNRYNLNALKLLAVIFRKLNNNFQATEFLNEIQTIDPLNHFARFEKYLVESTTKNSTSFKSTICNEFPQETYLELAISYQNLGLFDEAIQVLQNAPSHAIVFYWLAYLFDKNEEKQSSQDYLKNALEISPRLVYPHRSETAEVLEWVLTQNNGWKTKYYIGLIYWSKDRVEKARQLFEDCREFPDYPPFYLTRGDLLKSLGKDGALVDYLKVFQFDTSEWRTYHILGDYYNERHQYDKAFDFAEKGAKKFKKNYVLGFDYAKTLLYTNQFEKCLDVLENITILPHEGARYGHDTYRQACLLFALEKMKKGDFANGLKLTEKAKQWPENLGVGKPYNVDTRLENFVEALCWEKLHEKEKARKIYKKIVNYAENHLDKWDSNLYIYAIVLRKLGKETEAKKVITDWLKKSPESIIAQWSSAKFDNEHGKARNILQKQQEQSTGTPWNPISRDYNFKLILGISDLIN